MDSLIDEIEHKSVEDYLNETSYVIDPDYIPSDFALEFVNFIKLVNGDDTENKTPVVHYHMIDNFIIDNGLDTINMCHRGIAKSTIKEYLILYLGVYGELPGFGKVPYALYVSDSIENGVKKMRKALEFRWNNSEFLQKYIPNKHFTDLRWEFINTVGKSFIVTGHGAKTGVRGTRENGSRPVLALLDDLISDEDARSPTVISSVEDTVDKAIDYALHPTKRKVIWSGTPFNARDPLYKSVESGAYNVNVYPVCEKFPCTREEFRGSWEDRFTYDYVLKLYTKAVRKGKLEAFNQELMLRILSEEDRLIHDYDLQWYDRNQLIKNRGNFNFYITTDFATSEEEAADFSVITVWAYGSGGQWFVVDGICVVQDMAKNLDDLFRLCQKWKPQEVGVEVSGQQGGFVTWIKKEMMTRNIWFTLTSENNKGKEGVRPVSNKMVRFNTVLPWFKQSIMYFPEDWRYKHPWMIEGEEELTLATKKGFKSKHDDVCDTISMLSVMNVWKPSADTNLVQNENDDMWQLDEPEEDFTGLDSYTV